MVHSKCIAHDFKSVGLIELKLNFKWKAYMDLIDGTSTV